MAAALPEPRFEKYRERGAYHWEGTYPTCPWRYQAQLDANYQVAMGLLLREGPSRPDRRVVDIGCGDGVLLYKLWRAGVRPMGVDLDAAGLRLARRELSRRGVENPHLVQASAYALPFPAASLDGVVAVEVVEHLAEPMSFLDELHRILRSDGVFVLTTPRRNPNGQLHSRYHFREYLAEELVALLKPYFNVVDVLGYPSAWASSLYRHSGPPGKLLLKIISRYLVNLFAYPTRKRSHTDCLNLVALCRGKREGTTSEERPVHTEAAARSA